MYQTLLEIGAGFVVIALFANLVFNFVIKWKELDRNKANGKSPDVLGRVAQQIEQLYDWHNVRNADGMPVWYVPSALEKALVQLATAIDKQNDIMREVSQISRDTAKMVEHLVEDKT